MNLDNIEITFAKEKDFDEVDRILTEITKEIVSAGDNWSNYKVDSNKSARKNIFLEIIKSPSKIFIARIDDEIVGCINFQLVRNIRHGWARGHLEEVVVKKGYRHKGIGTKMINYVIDYCRKNNIEVIKLMCGKQLKKSEAFYRKNEFVDLDFGFRKDIG